VYADIRLIAERLEVKERGETLIGEMRRELESPADLGAARAKPRVLVEWWPKPVIVPGRDSWVNQLLDALGGVNPLADRALKSQPITDDEALELRPDAIVIAWCGVPFPKYRPDVVYRRPAWQSLPALERRRVYCVPEAFLGRPGPRLVEGHRALRRIVEDCASDLTR